MEQQVFEGTWEEIATHAKGLSGRRVRVAIPSDEEVPMLDQTLSELLNAGEILEPEEQQLIAPNLSENPGKVFTDTVVEKYKKQGFNL